MFQGQSEGEECKENFDCDVKYYCDQGICTEQKEFGLDCKSDYECVNNCLCDFGKCIFYFSLSNEESAEKEDSCLSGYKGHSNL